MKPHSSSRNSKSKKSVYIYIPKEKWETIPIELRERIRFYESDTKKYNKLLKEAYKEAGV